MPVSFSVAAHPAKPIWCGNEQTARQILATACRDQSTTVDELLQFSFSATGDADTPDSGRNMKAKIPNIFPGAEAEQGGNGFVKTVIDAYSRDSALVLRPDDVWIAILSQFSFFLNGRAELLRANFVAHEGKKPLPIFIDSSETRYNIDFGALARQWVGLIEKNVVDPALRTWLMPNFTTTTTHDTTVSAVLAMATLKKYFTFPLLLGGCGLPRVTLEGERADWVNILGRLEKLKEYGVESVAWYHLLCPVISRFVAAFDAPASAQNVHFWERVAHHDSSGGSGNDFYSGWITAFACFSKEGVWLGHPLNLRTHRKAPERLSAAQFWAAYARGAPRELVLDGTPYHRLGMGKIPPAFGEVDIELNDDGAQFDCAMVAGLIGARVSSTLPPNGAYDTVSPAAGWWIFTKKEAVQDTDWA
ncbi:hypothetical protein K438DRAFT_1737443 [Mycena galopus ATCC 62051]|nr:hypothetical protein K438DRAFT_1737443 [Mycena galopus ATCC 62051]